MVIKVTHPSGATVDFPDGTDAETISGAMAQLDGNEGPKTSALGAFATGLGQSALGFGDEIEAGVRAALDPNRTYEDVLPEVRQRVKDSESEHPFAYYGGEIGGSLAIPGAAARLGYSATANAAGRGLRAMTGAGLLEGGAYGAGYGLGKSEGGVQNRIEGAVGGGLMGGAVGAAAPLAMNAIQATAEPIRAGVNRIVRPEYEAARRAGQAQMLDNEAHAASVAALGPQRQDMFDGVNDLVRQGRAGQELRNIDVGPDGVIAGENTRALARSAANQSPIARDLLSRMTGERFEGQTPRFSEFVRGLIPQNELQSVVGNASLSREAIQEAARRANGPAYRAAYQAGDRPIWSDTIEQISGSPIVRKAMQEAATRGKDRAAAEGYGAFNPGVTFDDSGMIQFTRGANGQPIFPNLQYWDYVKRELDRTSRMAARAGDNDTAGLASQFARTLRGELDNAVDEYRAARGTAAAYFGADDALEAGQMFARGGNHDLGEVRRAVAALNPNEQRLFREGYVNDFLQAVEKSPDRRNVVGRFAQSPYEREKLAIALGPQRAREIESFLYLENLMDLPRTAMGNSTTARQLMELGLAGGMGTLAGGGNPFDPQALMTAALTYGATRADMASRQRLAQRIAEMLVSRDPRIIQQAARQAAHHGPMMNSLRQVSQALAQGARPAAGALIGGGMAQGGEQ